MEQGQGTFHVLDSWLIGINEKCESLLSTIYTWDGAALGHAMLLVLNAKVPPG